MARATSTGVSLRLQFCPSGPVYSYHLVLPFAVGDGIGEFIEYTLSGSHHSPIVLSGFPFRFHVACALKGWLCHPVLMKLTSFASRSTCVGGGLVSNTFDTGCAAIRCASGHWNSAPHCSQTSLLTAIVIILWRSTIPPNSDARIICPGKPSEPSMT